MRKAEVQPDLVERLRDRNAIVLSGLFHAVPVMQEAANEIERLRAQLAAAEAKNDVRWAIDVLLEKIAEKFEGWETMDIWRSDAALVVRGFKNDLTAPPPESPEARLQTATKALEELSAKVSTKIAQLEDYRENHCILDHAKTIADGRIQQANQIQHWIGEALHSLDGGGA